MNKAAASRLFHQAILCIGTELRSIAGVQSANTELHPNVCVMNYIYEDVII